MKAKIAAIIFIIIVLLAAFAVGYRVSEMKHNGESIITTYNQG